MTIVPAPAPTLPPRAARGAMRLGVLSGLIIAAAFASGCVTRTVYVTESPNQVDTRPTYSGAPYNGTYQDAPVIDDVRGVNEFYSSLASYGTWTHHGRYGQVFVPAVRVTGPNFRPYSRGHWEYTEWGWTFASHQPFGWATAHYGRWFYDSRLGWAWVPGTQWSPAWVTWRRGGGYVGWAPMPPGATYNANYSVYSTGWIFVSYNNFGADVIYPVMVRGARYDDCYRRTRRYRATISVRGRNVYRGPDPADVRSNGGRVSRRPLRDLDRDRPTSTPPRGVTVNRARERDGGDRTGYAGRDRTNRGASDGTTSRDRNRGRDRNPERGSAIIDDNRGVERRDRVTGDDRGRGRETNGGSTIIDNNRGLDSRDRVTETNNPRDRGRDEGVRSGSTVIDDNRDLGRRERPTSDPVQLGRNGEANLNVNTPNRGSRASRDDESSNLNIGSGRDTDRGRTNGGSRTMDNDRGVRGGNTNYGGQRAPDLSAEIPDDRPQRPYTDSPNGPGRDNGRVNSRTTRYRRPAPNNPGVLPKPAPMTKPSSRRTSAPPKASTTSRTRTKTTTTKTRTTRTTTKSRTSKSKSKTKSAPAKKSDSSKKSSRRRRR